MKMSIGEEYYQTARLWLEEAMFLSWRNGLRGHTTL
jgi:hypothetical protein